MRFFNGVLPLLAFMVAGCSPQNYLVYHPRSYSFSLSQLSSAVHPIAFSTQQGLQRAFYVLPRSGRLDTLWVFFPGNGSAALNWLAWTDRYPDAGTGFLLIDYPGYGFSKGSPSAESILEVSERAFAQLALNLRSDQDQLWSKTSVLGHSLGAATALQFAARHAPQRVVLVSPFTSLEAIGKRILGAWVGPLINNEYDNLVRMKELENRKVSLHIVHGSADEVVPVDFGRELSQKFPWADYQEVNGAHHNDIFELGRTTILRSMGTSATDSS
ncbi:alpha/beta hydrolase [Noviherbaspirillum sp. UKPF54]|uniref:alpha/beta hydrolase n=1 Tax=Noviherbaspirillum sp. UKPF54 TaxID=2601898 RepID=UPI00143CFE76|nr:alpha/beta hydrolase [Noviherbaspirillum sp. UKPF54]